MASGSVAVVGPPVGAPAAESYWRKAFDRLDGDFKSALGSVDCADKPDVLDAVTRLVEDKRQLCLRKRWIYKTPGGKFVVLRDVLENIARWINKYIAIGDAILQYDPVHAALPWAAFRFLLTVVSSDIQVFGAVVTTIETVSRITYRSRLLEDLYLQHQFDIQEMLEDVLVRMYSEILMLLSKTIRYLRRSTIRRLFSSAFKHMDWTEAIKSITTLESEVLKLASLADAETLARLIDNTLSIKDSVDGEKVAKVLDWLSSVPINLHHRLISTARMPDTGTWLLSHSAFQEWITASYSSTILVHGIRGCGKSSLFSAVVDHLLQPGDGAPSVPCAYFYCADLLSEPDRASPNAILRSIIRQLAFDTSDGIINKIVLSIYEKKSKGTNKNEVGLAGLEFGECISLLRGLTMNNPTYVAIDGIDELSKDDRAKLVEALEEVVVGSTSVVKVLLTSRDNTHAEALLGSATKIRISPGDNRRDIEIFVETQLQTAIQRRRILNGNVSPPLRQKLADALTTGAGEMFLWARLQLDFLSRKKTGPDILAAIEEGLHSQLDAVYGQAFNKVIMLDAVGRQIVRQLFSWLLFSHRPMKIEAMRAALFTDLDIQPSSDIDLVDLCFNLIVMDPGLGVFRFCHPSARDFMLQQDMFQPDIANQLLATACFRQCVVGPGGSDFVGDESPVKDFYDYAGVYWHEHLRQSEIDGQADNNVIREMTNFVFAEGQAIINPAFDVWFSWISCVSSNLPPYHRLKVLFRPLQSPEVSPLLISCAFGLSSLLDKTLEVMPDIDLEVKSNTGHTGIYLASANGHAPIVSKLIEANANPSARCGDYGSPMHVACFRGHEEVVRTLLRYGVSTQAPGAFSSPFEAACRGRQERIATLFAKEQVVVQTSEDYSEIRRQAIEAGFRDLVEWLTRTATLESFGLDYPDVDSEEKSLVVAIREGRHLILQSMLRNKPHLKATLPHDCMAIAAHSGHADMVAYLYSLGMNMEANGAFGSPLRCASLIGNEQIVRLLLDWGADVKARSGHGDALEAAAENGHVGVMEMLVAEGAEITHHALRQAAYCGQGGAVQFLVPGGADVHGESKYKDALYDAGRAAAQGGHIDITRYLVGNGNDCHEFHRSCRYGGFSLGRRRRDHAIKWMTPRKRFWISRHI